MGKLTVRQCDGAKAQDKRVMLADGDGLWLCVRPTGAKSWISRVKRDGKTHETALGTYPAMSLADARKAHTAHQSAVKAGSDRADVTFGAAFDRWLAHYAKTVSPRTRRLPTTGTLKKHGDRTARHLSAWLKTPLHKLTRGVVVSRLDELPGREEARQIFNMLRVFFEWCVLRGLLDESPLLGVRPGSIGLSQSRPAGRVLSIDELKLVYDMSDGISGHALRLIILTGCRASEVAGMRWDELGQEWWIVPAERMKNRKPHPVYIAPMLPVINEMRGLDKTYVFATSHNTHIRRDTLTTYAARLAKTINVRHFSPHDLRRSASTLWGELLKTAPHVVELMLSHAPENKLHAVYQRGRYETEQIDTWSRWALEFVNQRCNVSLVIPFTPRAKRYRVD